MEIEESKVESLKVEGRKMRRGRAESREEAGGAVVWEEEECGQRV
jgi:hypothetical protein